VKSLVDGSLMPDIFMCIRADMIGSRRSGQSALLMEVIEVLNQKSDSDWIIPFTYRAGDELIAIFGSIPAGFHAFQELRIQAEEHLLGFM